MKTNRKKLNRQAGEGEIYLFGLILIICLVISGLTALLRWIRATKDARGKPKIELLVAPTKRGLPGYQVIYFPGICGSDTCIKTNY